MIPFLVTTREETSERNAPVKKKKKKNSFEESLNHFKCGVYLKYFISFCPLKDASYPPIDLYKEIL